MRIMELPHGIVPLNVGNNMLIQKCNCSEKGYQHYVATHKSYDGNGRTFSEAIKNCIGDMQDAEGDKRHDSLMNDPDNIRLENNNG